jgi:hypothetical protein
MAKQALGRDLGTLLGRDPKESGAVASSKPDPAPMGAGVRSLVQKQAPAAPAGTPGIPRWYLLAGDTLLVGLALITIFKSPHPLSLGAEIFCVATVLLAAILGIIAISMPASRAGAGVTTNGEAPKQFRNHKAKASQTDHQEHLAGGGEAMQQDAHRDIDHQ